MHRRRSVVVRKDAGGELIEAVQIDNDPLVLSEVIGRAGEFPEVVFEATHGWYWAADVLAEAGARVHLAHPLGNNWGNRRVKDDERDAADLVDLLRLGRLVEAWIAPLGAARADPPSREARCAPLEPQVRRARGDRQAEPAPDDTDANLRAIGVS